ncbi:hypothetical protein L6164_000663 [Bauhinia variegata]|uniref:Uncharacterized protein n=1 Tax=Bauhinia variegata TaxID=167791 RepID=A0ACB9Q7G0_BAUVA|nr:hypothetical protein L6164_000663 [Bauhinia variegata]
MMVDQNQGEAFDSQNPDSIEPVNLFSLLRLNSFNSSPSTTIGGCNHHLQHHQCATCGCSGTNSMKRRSSSSGSCLQDPSMAAPESDSEPRAKKFCEQEDSVLRGFSAISLPIGVGTFAPTNEKPCPVLRRCVSDTYRPLSSTGVGFPTNSSHSPEHVKTEPVANPATPSCMRGSGLPPLPQSLKECISDPTPSPAKSFSRSSSSGEMGLEETSNSTRMKRMKDRLREMKQWWDEVMREGEEDYAQDAEDDKVLAKDDSGGDSEEAVSVEWAEKCLGINFQCPCGKGYKILLSGTNCYYKLV